MGAFFDKWKRADAEALVSDPCLALACPADMDNGAMNMVCGAEPGWCCRDRGTGGNHPLHYERITAWVKLSAQERRALTVLCLLKLSDGAAAE